MHIDSTELYQMVIDELTTDLAAVFKMLPLAVLEELVQQPFQSSTAWHYCVKELESRR